jgi:dTDP-4-dehydrorhamnose 3,5-epimerase
VIESRIKGVIIRKPALFEDRRGWLTEIFRVDEIDPELQPVMAYISITKPGVTRGPHEHNNQTDFLSFPGISRFRIHLWDNRRESPTFGVYYSFETDLRVPYIVIVPPGVVHAYTNIGEDEGVTVNCPDKLYRGEGKSEPVDEIRHEENPESPFKVP